MLKKKRGKESEKNDLCYMFPYIMQSNENHFCIAVYVRWNPIKIPLFLSLRSNLFYIYSVFRWNLWMWYCILKYESANVNCFRLNKYLNLYFSALNDVVIRPWSVLLISTYSAALWAFKHYMSNSASLTSHANVKKYISSISVYQFS